MEPRIDLFSSTTAMALIKHLVTANKVAHDVLPAATQELVKIRASQINGCGFCLDMHTKEAAAAGETPERLHLVATWREATVYSPAERAALALTEEATRIADGGEVSDDVWAEAMKHYDDEQLAALVAQIANIKAFNTLNVVTRQPAGDYVVGQFAS